MAFASPGVYVVEAPSGSAPIAGVGTSTPVFIGFYKLAGDPTVGQGSGTFTPKVTFCANFTEFKNQFVAAPSVAIKITTAGTVGTAVFSYSVNGGAEVVNNATSGTAPFSFPVPGTAVTVVFAAGTYVVNTTYTIAPSGAVTRGANAIDTVTATITEPAGRATLMQAVFGFFQNGGSGCYVTRGRTQVSGQTTTEADVESILSALETFTDIDLVAAPGVTTVATVNAVTAHCEKMKDRVAILDAPTSAGGITDFATTLPYNASSYAAVYYPPIEVTPLNASTATPFYVSPVGHIAGIYARVDNARGVHKAPANEVILGANGVQVPLSNSQQDLVTPNGINLIRDLNGAFRVWGARTLGGERNSGLPGGDFKYIHVRRLFNFVRSSIQQGTQWVVFEPNTPELWAKVTRNVNAFLLGLWRQGALFGATPEQAFYVKCDEETNPPDLRGVGQLNAQIGINITETAEFVIFYLGRWQPESNQ